MAVHLYGVARAGIALPDATGRQGGPLEVVDDDEFAVVVSEVDEHHPVGAADLMAHARVLEAIAAETTVLPMRFGIMLPAEEDVRAEVLERDRASVARQLDDLEGMVQCSVRVLLEEDDALRTVLGRAPELLALRDRVRETSPPASSGAQVHLGESVARELESLAACYAVEVDGVLRKHAVRVYSVEPASPLEVLNCALLVGRDHREELDRAVGGLRRRYSGRLVIRYVGPQPPYCFVAA
jgi:hypothetical protein